MHIRIQGITVRTAHRAESSTRSRHYTPVRQSASTRCADRTTCPRTRMAGWVSPMISPPGIIVQPLHHRPCCGIHDRFRTLPSPGNSCQEVGNSCQEIGNSCQEVGNREPLDQNSIYSPPLLSPLRSRLCALASALSPLRSRRSSAIRVILVCQVRPRRMSYIGLPACAAAKALAGSQP